MVNCGTAKSVFSIAKRVAQISDYEAALLRHKLRGEGTMPDPLEGATLGTYSHKYATPSC